MISLYSRIGGKFKQRKYFAKIIMKQKNWDTYVEPFLGSGQILLELIQYHYEPEKTYIGNDTEPFIYDILKDIQSVDLEKMKSLDWTPSSSIFDRLLTFEPKNKIDRLYRNLYLTWYSFNQQRKIFSTRRHGTRSTLWDKLKTLPLKKVKIYKQDYKTIIKRFDTPSTFFFLDPPYYELEKYYEGKAVNPYELAEICKNMKGKFILTYNNEPEVRKAFEGFFIKKKKYSYSATTANKNKQQTELIISNFKI